MSSNEWDIIAENYNTIFRPRFIRIYEEIAELIKREKISTVLDYACGVGEPSFTILENKENSLVKLVAADSSDGMLQIARQRLGTSSSKVEWETMLIDEENVQLPPQLDSIVCSLGLMYVPDIDDLLKKFHSSLESDGVLIASVWPHPSKVPLLSILKLTNSYICGDKKDPHYLENDDGTFSWWKQERVVEILERNAFELVEWNEFDMPMKFDDVFDIMKFSSNADWYKDPSNHSKARQYAMGLAKQALGHEPTGPFELSNRGVVFLARKK